MAAFLRRQYQRWLDKRIPSQHQIRLNQRRLFIFPSRQGFYFLLVLLLLLIAAINYQNNLVYALTFLLASLFNTAILMTYLNMSGLQLRAGKAKSVFAGEAAEFEIEISREPRKQHHSIEFAFPDNPMQQHDLVQLDRKTFGLHCVTRKRGIFRPGRLRLQSFYPLGFIRCWSWVDLDLSVIVYPKPLPLLQLPVQEGSGNQGQPRLAAGKEDFYGMRQYVAGDSLRSVNWRSLAKGQELQTKIYATQMDELHWVDWAALPGIPTEERLSYLCDWVLQLDRRGKAYGLRLPGTDIAPAQGDNHRKQVLTALALFGTGGALHV